MGANCGSWDFNLYDEKEGKLEVKKLAIIQNLKE